jgi:hypothetical protein
MLIIIPVQFTQKYGQLIILNSIVSYAATTPIYCIIVVNISDWPFNIDTAKICHVDAITLNEY